MASKELRPTLGTGVPKTRKRNIQTKLDPEAFRKMLFATLEEHGISADTVPILAKEDYDYTRYGEVFCEVVIAGNIVEPGGTIRGDPTPHCVFACTSEAEILEIISMIQGLMRRKPYLRTRIDSVMNKLIGCVAMLLEGARANLAIAAAALLEHSMMSANMLLGVMSPSAVSSGIALHFMTAVMTAYLKQNNGSVDKLMGLLKNAHIDTSTMVNMMPEGDRSADALSTHFRNLGLEKLVEQNERRIKADKVRALRDGVAELLADRRPVDEIASFVSSTKSSTGLSDPEAVSAAWNGCVHGVDLTRKAQQNRTSLLTAVLKAATFLERVCESGSNQIELITVVQQFISADMELLKKAVFCDVVYTLYQKEVLCEEAILRWFRRGMRLEKGSAASSNIIREQMVPFVKWLETAEEEDEGEAVNTTSATANKTTA